MNQNDIDIKERYILLLGILDNLHDFGNNCALSFILKKYYFQFIDFIGLKNKIIGSPINSNLEKIYNDALNISIKEADILDKIINIFENSENIQVDDIKKLNKKIIKNFKNIFTDAEIEDEQIIKLRQLLYFLIHFKNRDNSNIIKLIISYYDNDDLDKNEENKILNFIKKNKNINVTYPITYFDDMSNGLDKINYNYHIINLDKQLIDGADTMSPITHIKNRIKNIIKSIHIDGNEQGEYTIGFTIKKGKSGDNLKYYQTLYYLDIDDKITIEYDDMIKNKKINIKIKLTSNEISYISKLIEIICSIINDYWIFIKSNNFNDSHIINYGFDDILSKNEIINIIKQIYEYISIKNTIDNNDNLVKELKNKHLCQGFVVYLLAGVKRFGDWIQMQLSKKLYFMLQTNDKLCKAYGIIIGAPVEYNQKIYNHNPSKEFLNIINDILNENSVYKIFGIKNDSKIIETRNIRKNDKIIIENENKIFKKIPSRLYFDKYMKYKIKYLKLKEKLNYQNSGILSKSNI